MRTHLLVAAVLAAGLSATVAATAAEALRFPDAGKPAAILHLPDGWTHTRSNDKSMVFASPSRTASIVLSVAPYEGSLDDLATGALRVMHAATPRAAGHVRISGFPGEAYDSSSVNPSGVHVNVHLIVVRPDPAHVVALIEITAATISTANHADADSVLAHAQIVAGGS